ncbi:cytidylyltransferase domain-containing protein [Prochlorococcus marinus]|uniref:CMP-N-acetylneuraminic acid synthetase n=1 Tax=Prochlorococcus marinus (strain MIT 9303) TaxID=59922 RepID=A2C5W0_PROM3|nr:acylneuraminate cytidylyltransferase family protein [Prochlorococcus marinus]ABM76870.1 CMP-N-acetylneuraminic acid synthetase [Prochlorococcus marinus str. MIT 9303]
MNGSTHAFIFARGGSKGLPGKNIMKISGIPLIAHAILLAKKIKVVDRIFVSTDSDEIESIAKNYGAEIIQRPKELATDQAPEWKAWQHAVSYVRTKYGNFDTFLSLPCTSPLRTINDVERCLNGLDAETDIVITISPSSRNPWFNMVKITDKHKVKRIMEEHSISRRQDAPQCFDIATIAYVSRPEYILRASNVWDGVVVGVEVLKEHAIDIDTEFDFAMAKFIFEEYRPSLKVREDG